MEISLIKTKSEFDKIVHYLKRQQKIYSSLSDDEKEKVKIYYLICEYYRRTKVSNNPFIFFDIEEPYRLYFTLTDLAKRYNVSYKTMQRFRKKGYFQNVIMKRIPYDDVLKFENENPKYVRFF